MINKHEARQARVSPASSPRGKDSKAEGETTSFLWAKLQGSGVGYRRESESSRCIAAAAADADAPD